MKVLVVEAYHHPKVLENVYHLLSERCDLSFYVIKDQRNSYASMFPSSSRARVITNQFHSTTFFVWLLFIGAKYDFINISTGPETSDWHGIVNVVCFYLCCLLYGDKIILTIKSISPYLKKTGGGFAYIRSKGIQYVKRFTFETKTMRDVFRANTEPRQSFLGVSYDRYTDLLNANLGEHDAIQHGAALRTRVGLLGAIDDSRRDYETLCEVLRMMTEDERAKLVFVTLGECTGTRGREIIQKLGALVAVECQDGVLSGDEFDVKGLSCDVLISPLVRELNYGTFKGSGSFGDAVYLRKKIILPDYVDPEREFAEIGLYYEDAAGLLAILRDIHLHGHASVSDEFYRQFSTENVFRNLTRDLRLGCQRWSAPCLPQPSAGHEG